MNEFKQTLPDSEISATALKNAAAAAMVCQNAAASTISSMQKKKILTDEEYLQICDFIDNSNGLAIECELQLQSCFKNVNRLTLKSILQTELNNRLRGMHWRYEAKSKKYLKSFEEAAAARPQSNTIIIEMAIAEGISPVVLCRTLLQEKHHFKLKSCLTRLMKYPHLIEDSCLSANVIQCLCSDSQDGPLVDLRRRIVGEEYEVKLKELAKNAGMYCYDENDLRRLGFDKTPDLKMILPFLHKGQICNWIESKACFGDMRTHRWYIKQQLNSYSNRFGPGIVIYWFGYHEQTPTLNENCVGITVLDDFPPAEDLQFLTLEESQDEDDTQQAVALDKDNLSQNMSDLSLLNEKEQASN